MRAARRNTLKSLLSDCTYMCLFILVLFAAVGCQSQKRMQESLVVLQENMDSNAEKMVSMIQKLEENQQDINEDIRSLKASQHNITTQVIPGQEQLIRQAVETVEVNRQDQDELQATFQATSMKLLQSQDVMQENLATMQKNMDSSIEKATSLIQSIDENNRTTNRDVEDLKTAQNRIMTQVLPTQQQLVDQIAEATKAIRQDQNELQGILQAANAKLTQQVKDVTEKQQYLVVTMESIKESDQILQATQVEFRTKLADLNKAYRRNQEQLDLMKGRIAILDANLVAAQASESLVQAEGGQGAFVEKKSD